LRTPTSLPLLCRREASCKCGPVVPSLMHARRASHAVPLHCRFSARLDKAALAFLHDHAVHGRTLCPATALLEAAIAAGHMLREGSLLLRDTSFVKALLLDRSPVLPLPCSCSCALIVGDSLHSVSASPGLAQSCAVGWTCAQAPCRSPAAQQSKREAARRPMLQTALGSSPQL
jgi:hypothetical protein